MSRSHSFISPLSTNFCSQVFIYEQLTATQRPYVIQKKATYTRAIGRGGIPPLARAHLQEGDCEEIMAQKSESSVAGAGSCHTQQKAHLQDTEALSIIRFIGLRTRAKAFVPRQPSGGMRRDTGGRLTLFSLATNLSDRGNIRHVDDGYTCGSIV